MDADASVNGIVSASATDVSASAFRISGSAPTSDAVGVQSDDRALTSCAFSVTSAASDFPFIFREFGTASTSDAASDTAPVIPFTETTAQSGVFSHFQFSTFAAGLSDNI